MDEVVARVVTAAGEILLYIAPYLVDLNIIQLLFNVYKAHLKIHELDLSITQIELIRKQLT